MLDEHIVPPGWGIRPVLFSINGVDIPAYGFFVGLALYIGIFVYWRETKKSCQNNENGFYLAVAGLLGGAVGAKLLEWLINYRFIAAHFSDLRIFLYGRTIVGGLIGGTVAVMAVKWKMGIRARLGNAFAPAIALGVAIGRIGCFLAGCCYGKTTGMGWGVNFGDGALRYPTQLFESVFMLGMFFWLRRRAKNPVIKPGQLFGELMLAYFSFRFLLEFIKDEPVTFLGLTIFQYISVIVIIYLIFIKEKLLNIIFLKKHGTSG